MVMMRARIVLMNKLSYYPENIIFNLGDDKRR